ncbi:MAG: AAA family ATPase [archaeon]
MINKIKHLLNLDKQRYIIIGGIQGAGKSTLVEEFENKGYVVVCPDRIRVELAKRDHGEDKLEGELQEYLQSYSHKAFQLSEKRIKENLSNGNSVIFDAVNSTPKRRRQALRYAEKFNCLKIGLYIECPLDIALERNLKRSQTIMGYNKDNEPIYGRYVPSHIIKLKDKYQSLPTKHEGFDEINILHINLKNRNQDNNIKDTLALLQTSDNLMSTLNYMHENGKLKEFFLRE